MNRYALWCRQPSYLRQNDYEMQIHSIRDANVSQATSGLESRCLTDILPSMACFVLSLSIQTEITASITLSSFLPILTTGGWGPGCAPQSTSSRHYCNVRVASFIRSRQDVEQAPVSIKEWPMNENFYFPKRSIIVRLLEVDCCRVCCTIRSPTLDRCELSRCVVAMFGSHQHRTQGVASVSLILF